MGLKIINIENCYGIGKIQEKFLDFHDQTAIFYMLKMGFLKLHLQKA